MDTKHILLATDYSENAENAIDYALRLFHDTSCVFYVLNALSKASSLWEGSIKQVFDTQKPEDDRTHSTRQMESLVQKLRKNSKNPDHRFEACCEEGSLVNAVRDLLARTDLDVIFMGATGKSALKDVFLGSSAVRLIRNVDDCPIVVVPPGFDDGIPDEIAFATNFEHTFSKTELIPLIQLASELEVPIRVVRIGKKDTLTDQQGANRKLLEERMANVPHRFAEASGGSKVSLALADYIANEPQIGMLAMINYWHSFLEKVTKEEVVKAVAFSTKVPFLVLPFRDD